MSVDAVVVRGIRIDASLGILDWERQVRQPIEVDIEADVDTSELLATGDLARGVDFTRVIETVHVVVGARHEDLVEMARWAVIPVVNGLSDVEHPCQALAEIIHGQAVGRHAGCLPALREDDRGRGPTGPAGSVGADDAG